jgi:hypothetical protein
MTIKAPVQPAYGSGNIATPGAGGTGTLALPKTRQVIVTNQGANVVYVKVGGAGISASTSDYPVQPGLQVVLSKSAEDIVLAFNSPAGTTLHAMGGEGW